MVGDDARADVGGIGAGHPHAAAAADGSPGTDNGWRSVLDVVVAGSTRHAGAARGRLQSRCQFT